MQPFDRIEDPAKLRRLLQAIVILDAELNLPVVLRRFIEEACVLVDAEYGSKNFPEALAALDALSKREELPLASWYVRAVCYDNLGNLAPALDAYKKFLQLNTNQDSDMYFVATERVRVLTREMQNKKR